MNLLPPFRRDKKRDFASGEGAALLRSKVLQVLMTEPGELPWQTDFGAGLDGLRHQRNDVVLRELARVRIRDAFKRHLPNVELVDLKVSSQAETLILRVSVRDQLDQVQAEVRL